MTTALASAESDCTNNIINSDGEVTVSSDCASSYAKTKNFDIVHNPGYLDYLENDFTGKVNTNLKDLEDQIADKSFSQDSPDQIAADSKTKQEEAIEKEQESIERAQAMQQQRDAQREHSQH